MMNVTMSKEEDSDAIAVFSENEWTFTVVIENTNHAAADMNIYSLDEYSELSDAGEKNGLIVINETYLDACFKKEYGVARSVYLDTQIVLCDYENWPNEALANDFHQKKETILWRVLGEAISFAQGWVCDKWFEALPTQEDDDSE